MLRIPLRYPISQCNGIEDSSGESVIIQFRDPRLLDQWAGSGTVCDFHADVGICCWDLLYQGSKPPLVGTDFRCRQLYHWGANFRCAGSDRGGRHYVLFPAAKHHLCCAIKDRKQTSECGLVEMSYWNAEWPWGGFLQNTVIGDEAVIYEDQTHLEYYSTVVLSYANSACWLDMDGIHAVWADCRRCC